LICGANIKHNSTRLNNKLNKTNSKETGGKKLIFLGLVAFFAL